MFYIKMILSFNFAGVGFLFIIKSVIFVLKINKIMNLTTCKIKKKNLYFFSIRRSTYDKKL